MPQLVKQARRLRTPLALGKRCIGGARGGASRDARRGISCRVVQPVQHQKLRYRFAAALFDRALMPMQKPMIKSPSNLSRALGDIQFTAPLPLVAMRRAFSRGSTVTML